MADEPLDPNNWAHLTPKQPTATEVDQVAIDLAAAEDMWTRAEARCMPAQVCNECGGRAAKSHGSLGDNCFACDGTGQVVDEFSDETPLELHSGFGEIRGQLASAKAGGPFDAARCRALLGEIKVAAKTAVQTAETKRRELGAGAPAARPQLDRGSSSGGSLGAGGGSLGGGLGDFDVGGEG